MRKFRLKKAMYIVFSFVFLSWPLFVQAQQKGETKKQKDPPKTTAKQLKKGRTEAYKGGTSSTVVPTSTQIKQSKAQQDELLDQDKHLFRLIQIEEKTNSLKEKIFRSKAQLMLLQESLLHGVISTAKISLGYENKMGSAFYLKEAQYFLDGTPLYSKIDYNGNLQNQRKLTIYQGSIQPGQHTLSVKLIYRGNGFGAFSYLSKYKFVIKSSYTFRAEEKKRLDIKVVAYEKNWLTTPLKERPTVRYDVTIHELTAHRKKLVISDKKEK